MTPQDRNAPARPAIDWDALPHGGDLYGELHLAELTAQQAERRESLFPGLAICGVAAPSMSSAKLPVT